MTANQQPATTNAQHGRARFAGFQAKKDPWQLTADYYYS
jgi:hypothetical protein